MSHPVEQRVIESEPGLGAGDESPCLPGWIDSFCEWWEKGEGVKLSHAAVNNLLHTLISARQRSRRLVTERDKFKEETDRAKLL